MSLAESAVNDLERIRQYYRDEGVPDVGMPLIREIIEQIERLVKFPLSGRVVPEFQIDYLREVIYPPFRIVYRYDRRRVRVVRVWRSERLLGLADEGI